MRRKRFALIGAGLFGEVHAKAYSRHPDADLAAICDLNATRAAEIASRYGAVRSCTDWREICSDPGIDAASIATPDFAHTEIAVALARAGKHILVEKPLAMTVAECEQIIEAAKSSQVKLMVDFHNRWSPPFNEAHRVVRSGELGEPRLIHFRLSDTVFVPLKMLAWAERSSPLWFLGSHSIDMVCWLIGEWPARVFGVSRRQVLKAKGVDTPDLFESILEFPSGAVACIENCWLLPESSPNVFDLKCELVGSEGTLHIDTSSNRALVIETPERSRHAELFAGIEVFGRPLGFGVESVSHFADCVVKDEEPLVSGEVGLGVTRVACALEQSAAAGRPVTIER